MVATVSIGDFLAVWVGGVVCGVIGSAYLMHKSKQFLKRKSN